MHGSTVTPPPHTHTLLWDLRAGGNVTATDGKRTRNTSTTSGFRDGVSGNVGNVILHGPSFVIIKKWSYLYCKVFVLLWLYVNTTLDRFLCRHKTYQCRVNRAYIYSPLTELLTLCACNITCNIVDNNVTLVLLLALILLQTYFGVVTRFNITSNLLLYCFSL